MCRLSGVGAGGNGAPPRIRIVIPHQSNMQTTITVVTCIIRSACPDDSWIPRVFERQNHPVTATAKNTARATVRDKTAMPASFLIIDDMNCNDVMRFAELLVID